MKNDWNRIWRIVLLLPAVFITLLPVALAHGVLSEETSPGKVRFFYDDDSPVSDAYIDVFDGSEKKIATGQADADGVYDYSGHENVAKISAADVHGHRCEHLVTEVPPKKANSFNAPVLVGVVVLLLAIAAVFRAKKQ